MGYGGVLICKHCRYKTDDLWLDYGFLGPEVYEGVLALCPSCSIISSVNFATKNKFYRCPKCRKKLTILPEEFNQDYEQLSCPKCNGTGFEFIKYLFWD